MDCLELKSLFETSVRCLAISMQEAMKRQLMLLDDNDYAMNDHLAESMPTSELYEGSDVKDCLEGLTSMHKALQEIEDFEVWAAKNFGIRDWEAQKIASLMMGYVAGYKYKDLPKCAVEVLSIARELLGSASDEPSDSEMAKLMKIFLKRVKETTEKYEIDLEWGDACSLPLNYLTAWFEDKYYN